MVSFELNTEGTDAVDIEHIGADGLLDLLSGFHEDQLRSRAAVTGTRSGFQRVGFLLQMQPGHMRSMTLTIIKPDEVRYWTRSMAMRDADQLAEVILTAANRRSRA
jgi:hypothetical protein